MHTRREFLTTASFTLAASVGQPASLLARLTSPAAEPPQLFRVGNQIYSWGRYFPPAWWEACRACSEIGYPGIEGEYTIATLYSGRESEFTARMRRNHEELAALYSTTDLDQPNQFYVNRYKNVMAAKFAQPQGARVIVIGGTDAKERTAAQFVEYARQANAIGKEIFETTGLQVGVHPHLGSLVQHSEDIDRVMESTDPRYFNLCPDVAHLAAGGADPVEVIRKYSQRIIHVHFKDYKPVPGREFGEFVELGKGTVDFPGIVRELKAIGFKGWADVELDGAVDPYASSVRNRDYLINMLHLRVGADKENR
ncbi:MAG: sugar phosphate isomerase/epimerase family protein [Candidatus Acidiferrales bacterium]